MAYAFRLLVPTTDLLLTTYSENESRSPTGETCMREVWYY